MFDIVLYSPRIPQNTGNIIRLCANTGASLHLIHPLGFAWEDKQLRRSGLDYHEFARVHHHADWATFLEAMPDRRIWALTTRATRSLYSAAFGSGDVLLFGNETSGLPEEIHRYCGARRLRLPMQAESRSLNLSNSVAVVLYEAIRQQLPNPDILQL